MNKLFTNELKMVHYMKHYQATILTDKGFILLSVYASNESEAMNKVFMQTKETDLLKSIKQVN